MNTALSVKEKAPTSMRQAGAKLAPLLGGGTVRHPIGGRPMRAMEHGGSGGLLDERCLWRHLSALKQRADSLTGAVLRVFRLAAPKVAHCRLGNAQSISQQRLSPAAFAQRFEEFWPVHGREYIARSILRKHRGVDIS